MQTKTNMKGVAASPGQVERLVMWLRWPENKLTGRVPWFVILWRLPWFLLIYLGVSIAWVGVACCYGTSRATQFWSDAT